MAKKMIKTGKTKPKPEQPERREVGRPVSYKPEFNEMILDLAEQGKGVAHWASACKVCRDTLYQWAKDYPQFSDTLKIAAEMRETWWVDKAANQAMGEPGNAQITKFILASNFGMKERSDNTVTIAQATDGKIELKFGEVKPE